MSKKIIYCCFVLTLAATLGVPSYAGVTVSVSPISPVWPIIEGSTQYIATYAVPNQPQGGPGDPNEKIGENLYEGRGVMQTFTVLIGTGGFTLSDIVITAFGGGNPANPSCTLHLFDLNQAPDNNIGPDEVVYNLAYWDSVPNCYDWFSSSCSFIYPGAPPGDQFVRFAFSDYDRIDLEPNHLYTFEIWGPPGVDPGWYWIRSVLGSSLWGTDDPYPGGRAYSCYSDADGPDPGVGPPDLSAYRSQLTADTLNGRDMVMAVYGVPNDGNAYHPEPRDYQTNVSVNPTLTWKPGRWAASTQGHRVYFHSNLAMVQNRMFPANKGYFDACEFSPGTLAFNTTYYWIVDEYNSVSNPGSYWPGPVWQFQTVSPYASNPKPASGTTAQFKLNSLNLTWTAGAAVASSNGHKVYFGTDFDEVNDATTDTARIYRGPTTDASYNLLNLAGDYTLEEGQTYYWRIDEVNDMNFWQGPVWSFTMSEFITVEDFPYLVPDEMNAVWTAPITNYCLPDCYANPGGAITLDAGRMRFAFDNTGAYACPWSEAKADNDGTSLGQDWTIGGLVNTVSLAIGIDGDITSSIMPDYDHLYVAIEDSAGNLGIVYCDDTIIQKRQFGSTEGNIWNISLADLADGTPGPVDLTDINAIYIGFGPRCSWGPPPYMYGGTGVIYVDNIRLYMPRCLAEYEGHKSSQTGDFAGAYNYAGNWLPGDCDVDLYDLDYLSNAWLDSEFTLSYPDAVSPLNDTGHLTVWYKFDDGSGSSSIVTDSSGNSRHGTVGNPHSLLWPGDGVSGRYLNLEAGFRTWVEIPPMAYPDPNNHPGVTGVTFSFWSAYDMNYQPVDNLAAFWSSVFTMHSKIPIDANANNDNDDSQLIEIQAPTPWPPYTAYGPMVRFADVRGGTNVTRPGKPWAKYSNFGKRWNHYAFTYDDGNNIKAIYQNGALIASVEGEVNVPLPLWPAVGSFRIGTRSNRKYDPSWGFWYGKLDDFRIYNYALTEPEIQWMATNGTGSRFVPMMNNANLSSSTPERIDFADYAVFMQNWLMQEFWP